eukprot:Sdes_comp20934_c0_seq4m18378
MSVFTVNQVAEHSSHDDIWLTIHDKVYNVTKFLDEHPGGEEVIMEVAGRDATEAFEDVGHSTDARSMLKDFLVGSLKGSDASSSTANKEAFKDLPKPSSTANQDSNLGTLLQYGCPLVFGLSVLLYKYYSP